MAERQKVRCPECGAEMNFHAEKVDYSAALVDPRSMDRELGGVVEEFHTCPGCRFVLARPAR
jgi:ribosomal protein S27AE